VAKKLFIYAATESQKSTIAERENGTAHKECKELEKCVADMRERLTSTLQTTFCISADHVFIPKNIRATGITEFKCLQFVDDCTD
jgi:hypothetical protein